MALMVFAANYFVQKADGESQRHNLHQEVDDLQHLIDTEITSIKKLLGGYADSRDLAAALIDPENAGLRGQKVVEQIMATSLNYENVWVTDAAGKIVLSHNPDSLGYDCSNDFFFTVLKNRLMKEHMDVTAYPSPITGYPVFVSSQAILDESGRFLGILAIAYDFFSYSETVLKNLTFGREGYAFIFDQKGSLLAHPREELIFKDMSDYENVKAVLQGADENTAFWYEFDGIAKLMFFRRLSSVPWTVAINLPKADFYRITYLVGFFLILAAAVASIVLIATLILVMKKLVLNRVSSLQGGSKPWHPKISPRPPRLRGRMN